MNRRTMVKSLIIGAAAAAQITRDSSAGPPRNARVVARLTSQGLVKIDWNDIRKGYWIQVTDWNENGMVCNVQAFIADGEPADDTLGTLATEPITLEQFWGREPYVKKEYWGGHKGRQPENVSPETFGDDCYFVEPLLNGDLMPGPGRD